MTETGYCFKARGDDRVFLLIYGPETRVWDLGMRALGMSAGAAARKLGYGRADPDSEAWGRLILEKGQGGEAPLLAVPS